MVTRAPLRHLALVFHMALCGAAAGASGPKAPPTSLDAAISLCRRTYDYVAKSIPEKEAKRFRQEMAVDERWAAKAKDPREREIVEKVVRRLRRRIIFAHPDLQFDKLLCVQRDVPFSRYNHMVDQYLGRYSHSGPGLVEISNWRTFPEKKVLLAGKLPEGCVLNPDLHWDADRVLFAFCDHTRAPEADPAAVNVPELANTTIPIRHLAHRRYFIYECAIDGSWVRQLTGGPGDPMETADGRQTVLIEDMDPCYLPDGGFVFTSTRCQTFGRCHWGRYTPSFLLYRGEVPPVGASAPYDCRIRRLSFGEANEWEPSVLDDGRIAFTRWDYVNRHSSRFHSLWTVRPDGTSVAHLYGNWSRNIAGSAEVKGIPGSHRLVATATPHHGITGGSLYILDPRKGEDGAQGGGRSCADHAPHARGSLPRKRGVEATRHVRRSHARQRHAVLRKLLRRSGMVSAWTSPMGRRHGGLAGAAFQRDLAYAS